MARTRGWFVNVRPREPAAPSGVFSFGGAWGASEAIGRFEMAVLATPMALVMRLHEAGRSRLENTGSVCQCPSKPHYQVWMDGCID